MWQLKVWLGGCIEPLKIMGDHSGQSDFRRSSFPCFDNIMISNTHQELLNRLHKLQVNSARQWGKMTANEMLCHLSDSYMVGMNTKPSVFIGNFFTTTLLRWLAVSAPVRWSKGVPTGANVDPQRQGTKPADFTADMQKLEQAMERFFASKRDFEFPIHPIFGKMSEQEWLSWGYRHADHHFRQFGI